MSVPVNEWLAGTQQVRHCPREGTSRNTRPLKIPARGALYAHMITCPSSLEVRRLDRRADSTTEAVYLQSQKLGPELGVKGRRVRTPQGVHQRPLRRKGCRGRLPPTDYPGTSFQQIACAVPSACPNCRRLTANRGLKRVAAPRSIKRSAAVDYPYQVGSQADSAGSIPVTRSIREKRCSTSESDRISQAGQRSFTSETAPVPLRVPLAILANAPGDCQFVS
jgi:hypothetical protein